MTHQQNLTIQLFNYLNREYCVFNKGFITKSYGDIKYGSEILNELTLIFSLEAGFCKERLMLWATFNGLGEEDFLKVFHQITNPCMEIPLNAQMQIARDMARTIDSHILQMLGIPSQYIGIENAR